MIGVLQFAVGTTASLGVAALHDGTARPMTFVMAACGALALTTYHGLARRAVRRPAAPE
jgi:hypothetical protein